MPQNYTVKQVAQILGYSTNSIYTFLKEGRITGVRIGKGRFRIPQSELDRLFSSGLTKTKSALPPPAEPAYNPPLRLSNTPSLSPITKVEMPSLFDWFIATAAISVGLSLSLTTRFASSISAAPLLPWLIPLQITFSVSGLGTLLSDISDTIKSYWKPLFHTLAAIAFGIVGYFSFASQNYGGFVLFGFLSLVIILRELAKIPDSVAFAIYLAAIYILLPPASVFSQPPEPFLSLSSSQTASFLLAGLIFPLICSLVFLKKGYHQSANIIKVVLIISNYTILILAAFWFAQQSSWAESFLFLALATSSLFLTFWSNFNFRHIDDRRFVFATFGVIIVTYSFIIGLSHIIQTSIADFQLNEIDNELSFASLYISSQVTTVKTTLTGNSANPLLQSALKSGDTDTLTSIARTLFEANYGLLRVGIIDPGMVVRAVYPFDPDLSNTTFANQNFLQTVQANGQTQISEPYQTQATGHPLTVVIASPIFDQENKLIGFLFGNLDLDKLGYKLQQIATPGSGEYLTLQDAAGNFFIHPFRSKFLPDEAGFENAFSPIGNTRLGYGYNYLGLRSLIARTDLAEINTHWTIRVVYPLTNALNIAQIALVTTFIAALLGTIATAILLILHQNQADASVPRGP